MQEVTSPNKEADLPSLGAAQDKGIEGNLASKRTKKHVSREVANRGLIKPNTRLAAVEAQRELTNLQNKQKETEFATKGVPKPTPRLDEIHNLRDLAATESKLNECHVATNKVKKFVPKKLDFSHLQSTFDRIKKGVPNTKPARVDAQKTLLHSSQNPIMGHKNNSASIERDSNHGLKRKLDAIHKRSIIIPATNVTQEPSSANSAHITRNLGQQKHTQVHCESMQERQDDELLFSNSEGEAPQSEEGILEQEGSQKGKSKAMLKATTIDEFLKEHGIDVELEGLIRDKQSTELNADERDTLALDKNYSQFVMADIIDEGDKSNKKRTRGKTNCNDIYARTMEQREEVTFDMGQPIGPIPQSVSNLTSFLGTMGRNKRVVNTIYLTIMQTKFILPTGTEKWVIQSAWDAWKHFKTKIKRRHFLPYENVEDMVKNRPTQSISEKNKEHSHQYKFPHRMGPVNFARVRAAMV
ncbi:hypothetical protein PIB30_011773 [Stylosanthes scabra]|uniref:Uncharacterized protein n=1 Tax=Stylosanthes scabra TaxID=79078 RepID=A0ABU6Q6Y2_9FABA|nr:hypothetical protein [Stylosanthes scabra]